VPEVLLSGDHERIRRWRRKEALKATRARRPDLLASAPLSAEDEALLREIEDEERGEPVGSASAETALIKRFPQRRLSVAPSRDSLPARRSMRAKAGARTQNKGRER
jgi:hypothetical protein